MDDVILVGAAGGVGQALAEDMAEWYRLWMTWHEKPAKLPRGSVRPECVRLDVTRPEDCLEVMAGLDGRLSERVVLVNASGLSINGMAHKAEVKDWRTTINVNLVGAFNLYRAALPLMRKRGWGRIVSLSSVVGRRGVAGTSAYAASKAGLESLTRTLAVENASKGVTVNTLVLGYMDVGLINTIDGGTLAKIKATIPLGRFGRVANVVSAIRFLVDADYVTGTSLPIDGGFLCT